MKTRKIICLCLLLLIAVSSCEKEHIPEGDHTFSCKIDGKLFVPEATFSFKPTYPLKIYYYKQNNSLYIQALNFKDTGIFINIKDVDVKAFSFENSDGDYLDMSSKNTTAIVFRNGNKYLSKTNSGTITILEKSDTQIRGTFDFTVYNEKNPKDSIRITSGRFDN